MLADLVEDLRPLLDPSSPTRGLHFELRSRCRYAAQVETDVRQGAPGAEELPKANAVKFTERASSDVLRANRPAPYSGVACP